MREAPWSGRSGYRPLWVWHLHGFGMNHGRACCWRRLKACHDGWQDFLSALQVVDIQSYIIVRRLKRQTPLRLPQIPSRAHGGILVEGLNREASVFRFRTYGCILVIAGILSG